MTTPDDPTRTGPAPSDPDLVALVGSRIAHDLNNPVGAIANGVELLGLAGQADGPELALINESVENARRRIKRFRIAFGAAAPGQLVPAAEIAALTAPGPDGGRLEIDWPVAGDLARADAKAVILALMCIESALPWGGRVRVTQDRDGWQLAAAAERIRIEPALWHLAEGGPVPNDLTANAVHFALFARETAQRGRPATVSRTETAIALTF